MTSHTDYSSWLHLNLLTSLCCLATNNSYQQALTLFVHYMLVHMFTHMLTLFTNYLCNLRLWNSLPVKLRNPDITYRLFRRQPKGHLFGKHEHCTVWLLICGTVEKHLLTFLLYMFMHKSLFLLFTHYLTCLFLCYYYLHATVYVIIYT